MSEVVTAAPAASVAPAAPAAAPSAPVAAPVASSDPKTAASAPAPTDGEAKPDPKPETPESRENKGRDRRKISRLYREAAEHKARAELFERQLAELKKPAAPDGAPKLEHFDYDPEKYAAAKAEFEKTKAFREFEAKQRSESNKQAYQRLQADWDQKVDRADAKYEDFDEVVGNLTPGSPFVDAIMEAENAEDVAYYLGKNPKEAERIAQLHPRSQVREIGKLEAKLLSEPLKPKTPSKAPAPIAPLAGTTTAESFNVRDTSDTAKWIKERQKQVHGSRR